MKPPPQRMQRHSRGQFLAFGLLPLLNTVALLVHGLNLSTHGRGSTGRALVVILAAGLVSLLCAAVSAVKRGRDLGYETWAATLILLGSVLTGPLFLVLLAYLAFAAPRRPAAMSTDPDADLMGARWLWAPVLLIAPWMMILVVSALP